MQRHTQLVAAAVWLLATGTGGTGLPAAMASEPVCFADPAGAASGLGARGANGYRLEAVRRDAFSGSVWASVRSCVHPEWPGQMVLASGAAGALEPSLGNAALRSLGGALRPGPLVLPGALVRLVEVRENVRIESAGIAQAMGAAGDRIQVRLIPLSAPAGDESGTAWTSGQRVVTGIVRGRRLVEVETR